MKFFTERNTFVLVASFAFLYLFLRAAQIPLYYDELQTLNSYIRTGFLSPFNDFRAANNHIVNTYLTSLTYHLFGDSALSLRLFNLLAFIPYSIYVFKLGRNLQHIFLRWAFYLALILPINLIAFFALSRGYGLSLCFLVISVYYLYNTFQEKSVRNIILSALFIILALYSNLSLLLFAVISLGVMIINIIRFWKHYFTLKNLIVLSFISLFVVKTLKYVFAVLFYYKEAGQLWWGHLDGLWLVTVRSLIKLMFNTDDTNYIYQSVIIIASILMVIIFLIKEPILKKYNRTNLFFGFLIFNILGILLLAIFFKINYPFQRTGMHLYVFFIGAYCFGLDTLRDKKLRILFLSPILYIPIHFLFNMNLSYVVFWELDNVPDRYIEKVVSIELNENSKFNTTIYVEGMGFAGWMHQINKHKKSSPIALSSEYEFGKNNDYLIVAEPTIESIMHLYDKLDCELPQGACLYKRKTSASRKLLNRSTDHAKHQTNQEFYNLIQFTVDSLSATSIFFNVNLTLECNTFPFQSAIILSVVNKRTNEQKSYRSLFLETRDWKNPGQLNYGHFIDDLPINEELEITVYLYNNKLTNYSIHCSDVSVYQVLTPF